MKPSQWLIAWGWSMAPLASFACSFGNLEHEVHFAPGRATLDATEIRALVDWYVEKRASPVGISAVDVFAKAAQADRAAAHRAQRRLDAVGRLVATLSNGGPAPRLAKIEKVDAARPRPGGELDAVVVGVQPMCIKTRSCCQGLAEDLKPAPHPH